MNPEFWQQVWREGRTGFHEGKANGFLVEHASGWPAGRRVLVPLCGKTVDLTFLAAQGHEVVGVELAESAARAFFSEQGLTAQESRVGEFLVLGAGSVHIWVGDFFATSPELLGQFDAVYDRAALIALPRELRARYVPHLRTLLAQSFEGLLVNLEYTAGALGAPPFSVEEAEVRELWAGARVDLLEVRPAALARVVAAGIVANERAFRLTDSRGQ